MQKIGIVTLNGYFNYGNRLQNYALCYYLKKFGFEVYNIWPKKKNLIFKEKIKSIIPFRYKRFRKIYNFSKKNIKEFNGKNADLYFDTIVIGSDQVWNYTLEDNSKYLVGTNFKCKKISYAASIGLDKIPIEYEEIYKKSLKKIDYISMREEKGKEIVEKILDRKDITVNIDPTLLLTSSEWDKIIRKPKNLKYKNYILVYFLGVLSTQKKNAIEEVAKKNNCAVIYLLDKNSEFYNSGPEEFLYLEKNAFLICTDSFHSSVFAFLYNRPFVVFDRKQENLENMSSRIDTFLSKFKLENRIYNGKNIVKDNITHDYNKSYEILEKERLKSKLFFENALSLLDDENGGNIYE